MQALNSQLKRALLWCVICPGVPCDVCTVSSFVGLLEPCSLLYAFTPMDVYALSQLPSAWAPGAVSQSTCKCCACICIGEVLSRSMLCLLRRVLCQVCLTEQGVACTCLKGWRHIKLSPSFTPATRSFDGGTPFAVLSFHGHSRWLLACAGCSLKYVW